MSRRGEASYRNVYVHEELEGRGDDRILLLEIDRASFTRGPHAEGDSIIKKTNQHGWPNYG